MIEILGHSFLTFISIRNSAISGFRGKKNFSHLKRNTSQLKILKIFVNASAQEERLGSSLFHSLVPLIQQKKVTLQWYGELMLGKKINTQMT